MKGVLQKSPMVIRKNGERFIPNFPVVLSAGDQIIMVEEVCGWECPKGKAVTIQGYTGAGPIMTSISDKG